MSNIAIIGAGPAGLAMAGRLHNDGIEYEIFEASDSIAKSWMGHYDRLCLHTVKELSHLPFLEFPKDYPRYVPRDLLVAYYQDYAEKFKIKPQYGFRLLKASKQDGNWKLEFKNGTRIFEKLIFCSGVNRVPYAPTWPGMEGFGGTIIHSRDYKDPGPFRSGKNLVIGMGNTGAEIALDLANAGASVTISVRDKVLIVPRDILGNPSQVTANRLAKLPFGWGHSLGNAVRKLVIGDLSKYGLRSDPTAPVKHLADTGKTPVLDLGTVKAIRQGRIEVLGKIMEFTPSGMICEDGKEREFDSVILATGYRAHLKELIEIPGEMLDENKLPTSPIGTGKLSGVYFLGFDNYQLGGILGTIYRDSEKILKHITSNQSK